MSVQHGSLSCNRHDPTQVIQSEFFTEVHCRTLDQLFSAINHNPHHLLHHLLPPPAAASQNYELRHGIHNISLPDRAGISWMLTLFRE